LNPVAVLFVPLVIATSENAPTAVLSFPTTAGFKALEPTAVLFPTELRIGIPFC
jgi:hypothetical protein